MKYHWVLYIFVCGQVIFASALQFIPLADTIYVDSGCTEPLIISTYGFNWVSSDSIVFSPGFNTNMSYIDSMDNKQNILNSSFLIPDSLENYDYEVWYHPIDTSWFYESSFEVTLDSSIAYWEVFRFTLYVKNDSIVIDSSSQVFKATSHGLGTETEPILDQSIVLHPNYPNPFNAQTVVEYHIMRESDVNIALFDITGRRCFFEKIGKKPMGSHYWQYTRSNLPSGVYFFQIQTQYETIKQKWILLK